VKSPDAMATPVKFDKYALLAIVALHLIVQVTHGYSHSVAGVENTPLQLVFIILVITVAPLAAAYISWTGNIRNGAGLLAVSMVAAFFFGYFFHFVIESPDLHSNVTGEHAGIFFHSALIIAIVQFGAFVIGTYIFARESQSSIISGH